MSGKRPDALDRLIGRKIRLYRKARGWTQTELARRIGVTYQQLQKYEQAGCRVSASMLFRIGLTLGVSLDAFFTVAADQSSGDQNHKGGKVGGGHQTFVDDLTDACVKIAKKRIRPRIAALVREIAALSIPSR